MKRAAGLAAIAAVALAGLAWYVFQALFSREAEIRALHTACIAEFAQTGATIRSGVATGTPRFAKNAGDGLSRWLEGATAGVGEAVCGTLRDACTNDYGGRLCTAARERYR